MRDIEVQLGTNATKPYGAGFRHKSQRYILFKPNGTYYEYKEVNLFCDDRILYF